MTPAARSAHHRALSRMLSWLPYSADAPILVV
jgi:hypothetical protein